MEEEKAIYRILAQSPDNRITISAKTVKDVTHQEAVNAAIHDVLLAKPLDEHYSNFIVQEMCTEEDWKAGVVSFCPRCGTNLKDYELEQGGVFDCHECNASVEAYVHEIFPEQD